MVDTGSQLTVIDPPLAALLNLKSQSTVGLLAATRQFQASLVVPDSIEAGSHAVTSPLVAVQDLGPIQAADPHIRGVLGEDFLAHFDLLIDYGRSLVCLDDSKAMQPQIRGERIPLIPPFAHPEGEAPFADRLVISVRLSDTGNMAILLQLDSGSDGPILYSGNSALEEPLLKRAKARASGATEAQRAFAVLPPQDVRIGARTIHNVPFVTPAGAGQNLPDRETNGLLATVLFQRVYVNHTDRYVILDPR